MPRYFPSQQDLEDIHALKNPPIARNPVPGSECSPSNPPAIQGNPANTHSHTWLWVGAVIGGVILLVFFAL